MPNPSSRPDPMGSRYQNGNGSAPDLNAPPNRLASTAPEAKGGWLTFLAPFLGAFAAVLVLGLVGGLGYYAISAMNSSSSASDGKSKDQIQNVTTWQQGQDTAKTLAAGDTADIGWWTRTFNLPKPDAVSSYLQKQGITVTRIEPAHYETTPDATTLTYDVYAEVPAQLMHLQKTWWRPADPDMSRFAHVLVLNDGLPAGTMWDTERATVAAEAGSKLDFAWQVRWNKADNTVDTDRLPLSEGVFTQEQVSGYQTEAADTTRQLQAEVAQINAKVQDNTQAQLAQVPADPPKPEMLSDKFGGDGSGEPTRSAERIGGGTAAGAAGGALFGAAAGNAGLGAGIGAGVGLLSGLIYDGVSKSNDKKKLERQVAAENEERLDDWHSQIKGLKLQRSNIEQQGLAEREHELTDLENRIAANNGRLEGIAPVDAAPLANSPANSPTDSAQTPVSDAPPIDPVQAQPEPTADQPSGPIGVAPVADSSALLPASVMTVDVKNPTNTKYDQGNIQVTFTNGQTDKLTRNGKSSQPLISQHGEVGWRYPVGLDKDLVAVRMPNGMIKSFVPNSMFVLSWGFVDNDSAIVISSMEHHGPPYFVKYDLNTGKELGHVDDYDPHTLPAWAKPFDDN